MVVDYNEINFLKDPDLICLKSDYDQFLMSLTGPTVIDISGIDSSRTRVITTLIHGNEPSGLIAIHRWLTHLKPQQRPQTNLRFIICSVEAASASPILSHRFLEGALDLNRCFNKELDYGYFKRANIIAKAIKEVSPEVVVDIHNTSGFGPAFSVCTDKTEMALSLSALFCHSLIISDINLGALMEVDFGCQAVTIECGGSQDQQSHEIAYQGLCKLTSFDDISRYHFERDVDVFLQPLRLQAKPSCDIHYGQTDEGKSGLTLVQNIEQFNYGTFWKEQMLGWLDNNGLENLQVINHAGKNVVEQYFELRENQLVAKIDLNLFMATSVTHIAKTDCLLYFVPHKNQF
ncbi:succinylglutamate desuccinylase/aspartoacylase domain-containing protein [Thalassotalea crassostreae]|uniref:succinylglutamate desuccinylase/aspartoacylase domain-containing protein n=1 Tax=Thalassotalea crassostreae TaxID=1763536 RepID=UPI000838DD95|nr:succinylglutamate desuccinylase/aspartoacylase family protein [Thalassotalea crassostreae]